MKEAEQHRLDNNWTYAKALWDCEKMRYNLYNWTLKSEPMMNKIGVCNYSDRTITISTIFMRGANCNYSKVKKALMHEIAHALTPGHSHNGVWKKVCGKIGGDTRLTASMNLPGMNWSVYCYKCKWRQEYPNKPNMNGKVCGKCGKQPRVRYIK